ncbi:serine protease [Streptomyces sp. NPDC051940]|uniref:serine protease n=1 Tax=Streptomyces sp. NPDC051940 TaxID=3155675 RepID=UPI0034456D6B
MQGIRRLLGDCLVRISGPGAAGGTGFFVAPRTVVTCAHVVAGGDGLQAAWHGGSAAARIVAVHPPADGSPAPGPYPHPDLAVLEVERIGHPCVRLDTDEPRWEDRLHGSGYTRTWSPAQAQLEPVTFTYEGVHDVGGDLLKLAGGQAVSGMSGGPLLNLRTMGVCGVLKTSRDTGRAAGGWGVPVGLLGALHPEVLRAHDAFHRVDRRWREAADAVTPLLAGLSALSSGYAGRIENFLVEYLGRDGAPVPFGGRESQLRRLSGWLADPQAPPYALVAAEAGRGKSALLVRWAQEVMRQEHAHVVVVPVSIRFNTAQAGVVFPALATRLGEVYGDPPGSPDMSAEQWQEACLGYLRRPPPDGRPLLVVMDGLDEATDWHPGPDLFPAAPGEGVRVLASARYLAGDTDDAGWLDRLNWDSLAVSLPLPPMDREGVGQVLHAMGDPLAGLAANVDVVSELYRLSEGDPLLVRLYVEALLPYGERAAAISPDELPSVSKGLAGYFERWWEDQERQWRAQHRNTAAERQDLEDLLNALACALGPLSRDDLLGVLPRPPSSLRLYGLAREVGRFVIGDGRDTGFVYSHPRLGMFFRDLMGRGERDAWDERFVAYGRSALERARRGSIEVAPYAVRFHGAHLERAGAADEDLYALVDGGWLRAGQTLEGTDSPFLNDCDRAWRRAETRCDERSFEVRFACALARASVAARSDGIPAPLLAAATRRGLLTPAQALALCRRMTDERRRAAAVERLAQAVGPEWLDECVAVAGTLQSQGRRAHTLARLSTRLSARSARRALAEARSLEFPSPRAIAVAALSARLPPDERLALAREALDLCAVDEDPRRGGLALLAMAAHVPDVLRAQAVRTAATTPDPLTAVRAVGALARHLPPDEAEAAVDAVRARISETVTDSHRIRARFALAEFDPSAEHGDLVGSLDEVAPRVARRLIVDARSWIAATEGDHWPYDLSFLLTDWHSADAEELATVLPESVGRRLRHDLEQRVTRSDVVPRVEELALLAHLRARQRGTSTRVTGDLLNPARRLHQPQRAAALTALAVARGDGPDADELLVEALESAQRIDDVLPRIQGLHGVHVDVSEQALADLQNDLVFRPGRLEDDEVQRYLASVDVPLADAAVDAALSWVDRLEWPLERVRALRSALRRVSERSRPRLESRLLDEARSAPDSAIRMEILRDLAAVFADRPALVAEELSTVFAGLTDVASRVSVLAGTHGAARGLLSLSQDKDGVVRELVMPLLADLLTAQAEHGDADWHMERLLDALPPALSEETSFQVWEILAGAASPLAAHLLSRLPAERVKEAAHRTLRIRAGDRGSVRQLLADELTRAFPRLDPATRSALLARALGNPVATHRLQALLPYAGDRLHELVRMAGQLPFGDRVAAATVLARQADADTVAMFLTPLVETAAPRRPDIGLTPLLGLARLVHGPALETVTDVVAEEAAHRKPADVRRALQRLPTDQRHKVAHRQLAAKATRPWELVPVVADFPAECRDEVEAMAVRLEDPLLRIDLLGGLIAAAGPPTPDRLWQEVVRAARAADWWSHERYQYTPGGLAGLLRRKLPAVDARWVRELREAVHLKADPAERVTLLCSLSGHARAPLRGALLDSALDAADQIPLDRLRAEALTHIARSAAGCPDAVVRTLDAVSRIRGNDTRHRALQAHEPALRKWIASGTADPAPWDRALRRLSVRPRPLVVGDLALLATAGAGFLPDEGALPRAFLTALHRVAAWWS